MYFDIQTNPFFKPASMMDDQRRFQLINHYYFLATNARQEPVSFEGYVLYALLRGADIRKTSHMPSGDNALDALRRLGYELKRHLERVEKHEKPVRNFYLQTILGAVRKERGEVLGTTKAIDDHYGAISIDLVEVLALVEAGVAFYEGLGSDSEATNAA